MYKHIILPVCLLFGPGIHAAEANPHNVWLTYSQDENQAKSLDVLLTLALSPDDLLFLGAGQTDFVIKDETGLVFEEDTAAIYNFSVTYSTLRTAPWSLDIGYDFWGKSHELEIHTINLGTTWHGDMWSLGINLEQRIITIYTLELELLGGQRKGDVDSTGLGPFLGLVAGNWSWHLTGMFYDYSKDISRLDKLKNLLRAYYVLGPRTFSHTTALAEWYANTRLKYRFSDMGLGANFTHTVAATDLSETDSASMLLDFKLTKGVTLDLEIGRVFVPGDVTVDFGNIGLSFDF